MNAILHGVMLAFGLILPLGAQNVFIFQQGAWQKHVWQAFPAVIAAAVCDTILISAAVAGVSMIIAEIPVFQTVMLIGGFLFLSFLGWQTWRSKPQAEQAKKNSFHGKKTGGHGRHGIPFEPACDFGYCQCHRHKLRRLSGN